MESDGVESTPRNVLPTGTVKLTVAPELMEIPPTAARVVEAELKTPIWIAEVVPVAATTVFAIEVGEIGVCAYGRFCA
jgi:hypothetical protein